MFANRPQQSTLSGVSVSGFGRGPVHTVVAVSGKTILVVPTKR